MIPLVQVCDAVHYLPGVTNVGVVIGEKDQAVLIDSGSGDRSGRMILRALKQAGLRPVAILNTHAHGDHVGGNAHLVENTGARVYAPGLDSALLEQPAWGAISLFMGAEPPPELEIARYAPRPCHVDVLVEEGAYEEAGLTIQAVPLHGHTASHTGYLVQGVLFTGDALAGPRELQLARISYLHSVTCQLASLEFLRTVLCQHYMLGHDEPVTEVAELVSVNLERIYGALDLLLSRLAEAPQEAADLLAALCQHYQLEPRHLRDYLLLQATLYAYLQHLQQTGQVVWELVDRRLWWRVAAGQPSLRQAGEPATM